MKYEWIDEYILKRPGVTKDLRRIGTGSVIRSVGRCLLQSDP